MIDRGKQNLLGVLVDGIDYEAAVARIVAAARERRRLTCAALAVHGVMTGVLDQKHRHRLNRLDLVVPDGQPVRWGVNLLHGAQLPDRVYGPQLMLELCEAACREGIGLFLYGSTEPVLKSLETNLSARFPDLRIVGRQPSRFRRLTPGEKRETVDRIRRSGAAITFVGLGCPRQEVWAYEFGDPLRMPVVAVGAAFDFHAGRLGQAPERMQRVGLEWLYRLVSEPRRLWRRYLLLNPLFLALFALQLLGVRFQPHDSVPPEDEMLFG